MPKVTAKHFSNNLSAQNLSSGRAMVLIENGARYQLKLTLVISPELKFWTVYI
ncbi:hypothetical protein [Nostoc sp.]|uniref:hypothetical protein n=1 Tax=Nostoc sp. TaxID=1180 RepID=UPI002FFC809B